MIQKPIRVAKQPEDKYIVYFPKKDIKIIINDNVLALLNYLMTLNEFDEKDIDKYVETENISNTKDYSEIFGILKHTGIAEAI